MITKEENEAWTRVGKGTPGGKVTHARVLCLRLDVAGTPGGGPIQPSRSLRAQIW